MNDPASVTVHVVGNACVDASWTVPRFPMVGETLVASSFAEDLGGKGLNQAVAAARAGAHVRLWAGVGRDDAARRIRARLHEEAIDDETLVTLNEPTDLSTVIVDDAGDNIIISRIDCAAAFDPLAAAGLSDAISPRDIVVMQGNLAPELTEACLAAAKHRGAVTILNPSPIARVAIMPWPLVDWAIMNAGEAETLTERAEPQAAGRRLLAMGVRSVIVTLGARGALLMDREGAHAVAAPSMAVIGTAGAGDVVCGVFAGLLSRDVAPRRALSFAVAAASLSVARTGTLSACPTRSEIASLQLGASDASPP
jgi:ribokinase